MTRLEQLAKQVEQGKLTILQALQIAQQGQYHFVARQDELLALCLRLQLALPMSESQQKSIASVLACSKPFVDQFNEALVRQAFRDEKTLHRLLLSLKHRVACYSYRHGIAYTNAYENRLIKFAIKQLVMKQRRHKALNAMANEAQKLGLY